MSEPQTYAEHEPVWLVRSGGEILGPFSRIELGPQLQSRSISVLDEIRTPSKRWALIRDVSELKDLVRAVQSLDSLREENTGLTQEITKTTEIHLGLGAGAQTSQRPVAPSGMPMPRASWILLPTLPTYGRVAAFASLFLVMAALAFNFWRSQQGLQPQMRSRDEALQLARNQIRDGETERAVQTLEEGRLLTDVSSRVEFLSLMVAQGSLLSARAQLDQVAKDLSNLTGAERNARNNLGPQSLPSGVTLDEAAAQWSNLSALFELRIESWPKASEILEQALGVVEGRLERAEKSSIFDAMTVNLTAAMLMQERYSEAFRFALEAQKLGVSHQQLVMSKAQALLSWAEAPTNFIVASVEEISRWMEMRRDFRQEMLLLRAALQLRMQQKDSARVTVGLALHLPVGESLRFAGDTSVSYRPVSANRMGDVCVSVAKGFQPGSFGSALQIVCEEMRGDSNAAEAATRDGLAQFANDPHVIVQAARRFLLSNRWDEARSILSKSELQDHPLAASLRARICQKVSDISCVQKEVDQWLSYDPGAPDALLASATLLWEAKKREPARIEVSKGLAVAPNYRPLLALRREIEGG